MGTCAGVAGSDFSSLDPFGLQLANMKKATGSRQ